MVTCIFLFLYSLLILSLSVSMPTPHTLPISNFTSIRLKPVFWWGTSGEIHSQNPKSILHKDTISLEGRKFLENFVLEDKIKQSFRSWVISHTNNDAQARIPLVDGSLVQLVLPGNSSIDVSVHFETPTIPADNSTSEVNSPKLCIHL